MVRGKAFRRHHAEKARARARRFLGKIWLTAASMRGPGFHEPNNVIGLGSWYDAPNKLVGLYASTHCRPCSCMMCGNARRVYGEKSLQERKAEQRCRY